MCLGIAAVIIIAFLVNSRWIDRYDAKKLKEVYNLPVSSRPILVIDDVPVIDFESS